MHILKSAHPSVLICGWKQITVSPSKGLLWIFNKILLTEDTAVFSTHCRWSVTNSYFSNQPDNSLVKWSFSAGYSHVIISLWKANKCTKERHFARALWLAVFSSSLSFTSFWHTEALGVTNISEMSQRGPPPSSPSPLSPVAKVASIWYKESTHRWTETIKHWHWSPQIQNHWESC